MATVLMLRVAAGGPPGQHRAARCEAGPSRVRWSCQAAVKPSDLMAARVYRWRAPNASAASSHALAVLRHPRSKFVADLQNANPAKDGVLPNTFAEQAAPFPRNTRVPLTIGDPIVGTPIAPPAVRAELVR